MRLPQKRILQACIRRWQIEIKRFFSQHRTKQSETGFAPLYHSSYNQDKRMPQMRRLLVAKQEQTMPPWLISGLNWTQQKNIQITPRILEVTGALSLRRFFLSPTYWYVHMFFSFNRNMRSKCRKFWSGKYFGLASNSLHAACMAPRPLKNRNPPRGRLCNE